MSKSGTGITDKDVPKLYQDRKYDVIERYVLEELEMCEKLFHGLTRKYLSFFKGRISRLGPPSSEVLELF